MKHLGWCREWDSVVFSDEKKFDLDGLHYHWHDLSQDQINFSRRALGGGGVMVWVGFSKTGKTRLEFVLSTMNSTSYIGTLERNLLPICENLPAEHTFQQDNASCHRSNQTKEWLREKEIKVMEWPALSPDLNPIENLWGSLVRRVYSGSKQYNDVNSLKEAILEAWSKIETEELANLIHSMHKRIVSVIRSKGDTINY